MCYPCPRSELLPMSPVAHRRTAQFAEQAVGAEADDCDRDDLADAVRLRHHVHRLQIRRAAGELAGMPTGLFQENVEDAADAALVENLLAAVDRCLQRGEARGLHGFRNL